MRSAHWYWLKSSLHEAVVLKVVSQFVWKRVSNDWSGNRQCAKAVDDVVSCRPIALYEVPVYLELSWYSVYQHMEGCPG